MVDLPGSMGYNSKMQSNLTDSEITSLKRIIGQLVEGDSSRRLGPYLALQAEVSIPMQVQTGAWKLHILRLLSLLAYTDGKLT